MGQRGKVMQAEVLGVLRASHGPLSAYEVLAKLNNNNPGIAPTTIYRSLASLIEQGHVHRLESLNAFIACQCDGHEHAAILSICNDCGMVEENVVPEVLSQLSSAAGKSGFMPQRHVIEIHGVCATCSTGHVS